MHSTKSEILALLKRTDGATVDELASSLGLASMTVRQHLTALERDGAVRAHEVRRPAGRPHFLYQLTEDGHRRTADGYDRLVALLVAEAGHLQPDDCAGRSEDERRAVLFARAARSLAARHRAEIDALAGASRIERIAAVLRTHGGFADWHEADGGWELRDFGCAYRANVCTDGPCAWHDAFLRAIVDDDVSVAPGAPDGCADCCRYIIAARVDAPAGSRIP